MTTFLRLVASEPDIARVPVMIDSSKWSVIEAGPEVRAGQGDRQLDQPQGGRGALPRRARADPPLRRGRRRDGLRRGRARPRPSRARSRSASARTTCSRSAPGSTPRTSSSTRTSSRSRPGSPSTTTTPPRSSRRPGGSRSGCPARASRAASRTCRSRSAATSRCARRCTRYSSTTRSPPGSIWRSSTPASSRIYEEIEPELRERVEDVILNRRPDATERLLEIAERYRDRPAATARPRSRVARAAGARAPGPRARQRRSTSSSSRTPRRRASARRAARGDRGAADGRDERRRRPLRRGQDVPAAGRQVGARDEAGRRAPRAVHGGRAPATRAAPGGS